MNSQESITIFITYLLRYLYLIHRDSNIYLDILYLHTIYYSSFIKRVIFIVARQKISAASAGDYLLFVVLLGSLESPPSIMVTRNLWSARV
jgi:hypothetical protein